MLSRTGDFRIGALQIRTQFPQQRTGVVKYFSVVIDAGFQFLQHAVMDDDCIRQFFQVFMRDFRQPLFIRAHRLHAADQLNILNQILGGKHPALFRVLQNRPEVADAVKRHRSVMDSARQRFLHAAAVAADDQRIIGRPLGIHLLHAE